MPIYDASYSREGLSVWSAGGLHGDSYDVAERDMHNELIP